MCLLWSFDRKHKGHVNLCATIWNGGSDIEQIKEEKQEGRLDNLERLEMGRWKASRQLSGQGDSEVAVVAGLNHQH